MLEVRDWLEIAALVITVGGVLWRLGSTTGAFTKEMSGMKEEMKDFADKVTVELSKVNDILVELAKVDGRIGRVEERQLSEGKRVDELNRIVMRSILKE